jgi:hypothetical protein
MNDYMSESEAREVDGCMVCGEIHCTCPDFIVTNEGSLILFHPETDAAVKFLDSITVWSNSHLRWGDSFAVEHRFAADLAQQLKEEGFKLQ